MAGIEWSLSDGDSEASDYAGPAETSIEVAVQGVYEADGEEEVLRVQQLWLVLKKEDSCRDSVDGHMDWTALGRGHPQNKSLPFDLTETWLQMTDDTVELPTKGQMTAGADTAKVVRILLKLHVLTVAVRPVWHSHLSHCQRFGRIPAARASLPASLQLRWRSTIGDC